MLERGLHAAILMSSCGHRKHAHNHTQTHTGTLAKQMRSAFCAHQKATEPGSQLARLTSSRGSTLIFEQRTLPTLDSFFKPAGWLLALWLFVRLSVCLSLAAVVDYSRISQTKHMAWHLWGAYKFCYAASRFSHTEKLPNQQKFCSVKQQQKKEENPILAPQSCSSCENLGVAKYAAYVLSGKRFSASSERSSVSPVSPSAHQSPQFVSESSQVTGFLPRICKLYKSVRVEAVAEAQPEAAAAATLLNLGFLSASGIRNDALQKNIFQRNF